MDYNYFTEKERQYIIDCWSSFKNEGNSYRDKIAAFNVDFYNNDFKPNLINIDSYIGNIDDRYYSDSYELKSKINKFLSELNYKDDRLRIAKECFGFDMRLFEGFSMDVVNLIDYKFKSNQINTLEDAYNCFKEYNNFTGIDYSLEEYKEMVENEIKELKQNNTYDCSIEQREDILLKLTTNIYKYYSITKRETDFHRMTLKHFNPSEAIYISDVYNEYRIYSRREKHYEGSYYYGDYFLEYFKEENAYLEKNFEERLEKKTFKNPKFEEYYNQIVEIFELEKVFKDTEEKKNYFNLLEFKFKVYNEEGVGIYNLEQAYEICKDLSLILGKANAIKVFESCYQLNPNSQVALSDSNFNLTQDANMKEKEETITQSNTSLQSDLCVGCYDAKRTRELYDECCDVVFKYCNLEDFVNSLNNPDECNLEVINKNLLYVLYTYFFNFFGEEAYTKIELLNEKFNIIKADYIKKKYREESPNRTKTQINFNEILSKI